MKPSTGPSIGKAIVRIPKDYPHVSVKREAIEEPSITLSSRAPIIKTRPATITRAPIIKTRPATITRAPIIKTEQVAEMIPMIPGNRFMDMFQMAGGIPTSQYLNTTEAPAVAISAPELATTIRALPEGLIKEGKITTFLADELVRLFHGLTNGDIYTYHDIQAKRNTKTGKLTVTPQAVNRLASDIRIHYDDYIRKRGIYTNRTRDYAPLDKIDNELDLIMDVLKPYLSKYRKSIIPYDTLRNAIQDLIRYMI